MPSENRGAPKPKRPPARRPAAARKRPGSPSRSGRPPGRPVYELRQGNAAGKWAAGLGIIAVAAIGTGAGVYSSHRWHPRIPSVLSHLARSKHFERPVGMAPVAFAAYLRACNNAGVGPRRIELTIGESLPGDGSHRRDGTVKLGSKHIDYTAAVDISTHGLDSGHRARLAEELTRQGFASWYRSGAGWKGHEHIHALYALLPMKPELRNQLKEFLADRRRHGDAALRWERTVSRRLTL